MKITIIREDENSGKKALSTCEADAFCERIKTEMKAGYVSGLREVLPRMDGTDARYIAAFCCHRNCVSAMQIAWTSAANRRRSAPRGVFS
ncbi:hypothetical protein [Phocaeicola sp.]